MSFRTSLKNLIRRDPAASLRERAASLRASISTRTVEAQTLLAPGSEEAKSAWQAACHEHSIRTVPLQDCPELMRTEQDVWSTKSLMQAMAAGEITVVEYARLHPIASERELRFAEISHELNLGGLFALAYADEYPVKSAEDDSHPATVEEAASLDFTAYAFDTPTRDPSGWMKEFAPRSLGMHIADRTLRMSKPELVAFIQEGGESDAEVPAAMLDALTTAQKTFEGWGKLLDVARCRYLVAGASAVLSQNTETEAEGVKAQAQPEEPPAALSLVPMLDLASATMTELQTVREVAQRIGDVAYAQAWGPRCQRSVSAYGASDFNDAGKLVQWIGDALTDVESAVNKEVRRRRPTSPVDRETRLEMLALPVIQNGDPDEAEAFARELLAHVESERAGR